jgi:hypothetical protein
VRVQTVGDLSLERGDLGDDHLERGHEREHDLSAAASLGLAGTARGGGPQPAEELRGGLAVGVVVRPQERRQALLAQQPRVDGLG